MAQDRNRDILSGTGVQNWNPTTVEAFVLEKTFLEDVVRPLVRALVHSRLQTAGLAPTSSPGPALRNDLLNIRDALFEGIGSAGAAPASAPVAQPTNAPSAQPRTAAGPSSAAAAHSLINNTSGTGSLSSADVADSSSHMDDETMEETGTDHSLTADSSTADSATFHFDISQLGQLRRLTPHQRKRSSTRNRTCEGCGMPHNNKFRRGPNGPGTLCDKCGAKWKKIMDSANQDRQMAGNSSLLSPGTTRPVPSASSNVPPQSSGLNRPNGASSSVPLDPSSREVASAAAAAAAAAMAAADVAEEQERRRREGQGSSASQSNRSPPAFYPPLRPGQTGPAQGRDVSEPALQPSPYNVSNGPRPPPPPPPPPSGGRPSGAGSAGTTASPPLPRQPQMAPPTSRPQQQQQQQQQEQGPRNSGGPPPGGPGSASSTARTAAQAFLTAMHQRNGASFG